MNDKDYETKLVEELEKYEERKDREELLSIINDMAKKILFLVFKKVVFFLIFIFILFIVINFIIFNSAYNKALKEKYYPEAKANLVCAYLINKIYIFPLTKISRWEHPITKPFYRVRDDLYMKGLSLLPPEEGEREVWWYKIRYTEFREVVENHLLEYGLNTKPRKFLYKKVNYMLNWNSELYEHIELIARAKITDKKYSKQKLLMFITLARLSEAMDKILKMRIERERRVKAGIHDGNHIYPDDKFVKKFNQVFITYKKLIESSKKHDKESYNYVFSYPKRKVWDAILRHDIALDILQAKQFRIKNFSCSDKYVKVFADAQKEIRTFYYLNKKKLSFGMRQRLGMSTLTIHPFIAYECRYNPDLQDYVRYSLKEYNDYGFKSKKMDLLKKEFGDKLKGQDDGK